MRAGQEGCVIVPEVPTKRSLTGFGGLNALRFFLDFSGRVEEGNKCLQEGRSHTWVQRQSCTLLSLLTSKELEGYVCLGWHDLS